MEIFITKKENHFPQKYLAEWTIDNNGYSYWFNTQKDLKEYFARWNAKITATNFKLRGC